LVVDTLAATVQADIAALELAKVQLSYTVINSPMDSVAGAVLAFPGGSVKANDTSLVVINQLRPIYATFAVPENQLAEISRDRAGKKLKVEARTPGAAGKQVVGELVFIDNNVNAQTGTIIMKAALSNDKENLWPGQFVAVRMVLTTEPAAIVAPEAAIQPGQQGSFVYVFQPGEGDAAGRAKFQAVKIDRQLGDRVVIASGLKGGELVITEIPPGMSANSPVRLPPPRGEGKGASKKGESKGEGKGEGKAAAAEGEAKGAARSADAAAEPRKGDQAK
jgi:multidrug efflux system membrane fusion protein